MNPLTNRVEKKPEQTGNMADTFDEISARLVAHCRAKERTPEQTAELQRELEERRLRIEETNRQHACLDLAKAIGKRYSQAEVKLETYQIYHAAQKAVVERVMQLCQEPLSDRGVVFFGPAGTGKDRFLAALMYAAIAKSACPGRCVSWWNGSDLFGHFRDLISSEVPEHKALQEFSKPELLAISDPTPPNGKLTDWNLLQFGRIIDRRYRDCKPTCITINASNEQDASDILTAPIWGRLVENSEVIPCRWPDFRTRRKA